MQFLKVFFFVFFLVFSSQGQHHVSLSGGRNRLDYLSGFQYAYLKNAHTIHSGFELGITRTFVQRRFNPRVSIGYQYDFLSHPSWSFGPAFQFAHSWLRIIKEPAGNVRYNEIMGGYVVELGDRVKVAHQLYVGAMAEGLEHSITQEKELFWSTGYYASFGIKYCL